MELLWKTQGNPMQHKYYVTEEQGVQLMCSTNNDV